MSDHANHAAATAAGYARIQIDRGAGKSPRFVSRYEKPMIGEVGASGHLWVAEATSDVSQAAADTAVLAALNSQRSYRYGPNAGVNFGSKGSVLVVDSS